MADRSLSPETKLLLAAQKALRDRSTEAMYALRRAAEVRPSPAAGPGWCLLRGAAEGWVRVGERHPLRAEIERLFRAAVELAAAEGFPAPAPTYKGGALRHFEKGEQ